MPEGTSLNRTYETMNAINEELEKIPGVTTILKIAGYDSMSGGTKSSGGTFFIGLSSWSERTTPELSVNAIVRQVNMLGKNHPEARIMAFTTPALPGLGMTGGWSMELLDMLGYSDQELDKIAKEISAAANQRPELQGVRTTFSAYSPICEFEINRDKAKKLGVNFSDVYNALQVNYGGSQIGDFIQFGKSYKIVLQSDALYRNEADALRYVYVRNSSGGMVPLNSLLEMRTDTSASIISRFNGVRSVKFQGNAASGYSSGQAIAAMEEVVAQVAPAGFSIEWSGQSREEKKSSGSTLQVLGLALVFVFLCLAALYESWSIPLAVLLSVPTGIFGAFFVQYIMFMMSAMAGAPNPGLMNTLYMQIGIIMIIGLGAKNAILIVEFAKAGTDKGKPPIQAAIEAAGLRLRPILMTSCAYRITLQSRRVLKTKRRHHGRFRKRGGNSDRH